MELNQRLSALRQTRMSGQVREAYDAFMAALDRAELAAHALKPGEPMPGFLLPNAEGRLVALDDLLATGPVVVTFFRGDWCPYCTETLRTLERALPAISDAGAHLLALTPETGGRALRTKLRHGLHYEVLADVDNLVAMQCGVLVSPPEGYRALLRKAGVDLAGRHGNAGWSLPVPATFLVGQDGIVRDAWVDPDFTRRAEPAAVLDALRRAATASAASA